MPLCDITSSERLRQDLMQAQLLIPPLSAAMRLHNALVEGYRNATETLLGIVLFFAEYC